MTIWERYPTLSLQCLPSEMDEPNQDFFLLRAFLHSAGLPLSIGHSLPSTGKIKEGLADYRLVAAEHRKEACARRN